MLEVRRLIEQLIKYDYVDNLPQEVAGIVGKIIKLINGMKISLYDYGEQKMAYKIKKIQLRGEMNIIKTVTRDEI